MAGLLDDGENKECVDDDSDLEVVEAEMGRGYRQVTLRHNKRHKQHVTVACRVCWKHCQTLIKTAR